MRDHVGLQHRGRRFADAMVFGRGRVRAGAAVGLAARAGPRLTSIVRDLPDQTTKPSQPPSGARRRGMIASLGGSLLNLPVLQGAAVALRSQGVGTDFVRMLAGEGDKAEPDHLAASSQGVLRCSSAVEGAGLVVLALRPRGSAQPGRPRRAAEAAPRLGIDRRPAMTMQRAGAGVGTGTAAWRAGCGCGPAGRACGARVWTAERSTWRVEKAGHRRRPARSRVGAGRPGARRIRPLDQLGDRPPPSTC